MILEDKPYIVPKAVFLDTEVFVEAHFDYGSRHLRAILEYSTSGLLTPFLTDITVREIKANIRERLGMALSGRPARILANSSLPAVRALHTPIPLEVVEAELVQQLDDYLAAIKAVVLPVKPPTLKPVLDRYFELRPPFGAGKRKSEFPDAFAFETLSQWCYEQETPMAVVTRDRGMIDCCQAATLLVGFESVAAYLDALASREAALSQHIRDSIWAFDAEIVEGVRDVFPALAVTATAGNTAVDVQRLDLRETEFCGDPEIVYLAGTEASVELPVVFRVVADVGYMGYGPPRQERWIHESLGRSIDGIVSVDLALTATGEMSIEDVNIAEPEEFSIDVLEDAEPWS